MSSVVFIRGSGTEPGMRRRQRCKSIQQSNALRCERGCPPTTWIVPAPENMEFVLFPTRDEN